MIPVPNLPQALEAGLRAQEENDNRDNSVLHVSDLAAAIDEACPRSLWLRLQGAKKKEPTTGMLLMWDHGRRTHERLIELMLLPKDWKIQAVEKPVVLGPVIGRYDTRLFNALEGWEIIVDFKTVRGRKFGYLDEAMPGHILQVQAYIAAADADGGLVFYVDREGQNFAKQFYVERNDDAVWQAIEECVRIMEAGEPPEILPPKLNIGKNKGPDSVKLEMPWQCSYCDYIDVSCPGALPKKMRELGIVGYVHKGDSDEFKPKVKGGDVVGVVEDLLVAEGVLF